VLEQKIEELTQAVVALTERLATNNQSDAYRKAKAIEDEPEMTEATPSSTPVEAANDAIYDMESVKKMVTDLAKDTANHKALQNLLKDHGASVVSKLPEDKLQAFGEAVNSMMQEAS
jgi:hypothetical protein